MSEIAITVAGARYKAKNMDEAFAAFVEEDLKESEIFHDRDNSAEQLFGAYLRLANKWFHYEREIDDILSSIEKE